MGPFNSGGVSSRGPSFELSLRLNGHKGALPDSPFYLKADA